MEIRMRVFLCVLAELECLSLAITMEVEPLNLCAQFSVLFFVYILIAAGVFSSCVFLGYLRSEFF